MELKNDSIEKECIEEWNVNNLEWCTALENNLHKCATLEQKTNQNLKVWRLDKKQKRNFNYIILLAKQHYGVLKMGIAQKIKPQVVIYVTP